jgi:acetyltransferase
MCGHAGLHLPPLNEQALTGINSILKGFGWAANPADVTGYANSESFPQIMDCMINQPEVGSLVVASSGADSQAEQVIRLRDSSEKAVAFLWTGSRGATAGLNKLKAGRIPVFYSPDALASGLKRLLDYHAWREHRQQQGFGTIPAMTLAQQQALARLRNLGRTTLSESESTQVIAAWGVPVAREIPAESADAAVAAAQTIGYPVALKADSPAILHKTEAGVIRLGLRHAEHVRTAFAEVQANAVQAAPAASGAGALVQEMVPDGVEVIIGVSYDEQLGPMLLFGTGGVLVEVYNDVALRHCPITPAEAMAMVAEVKGARLLHGFRGRPAADREALADTLVRVSHLAVHLEGTLTELDINPLMVLPAGQGVKAVDALMIVQA